MIKKLTNRFFTLIPENNQLERIWILAKTDFKKRYYGTSLGIVWALINPLIQLLIYYFIFSVFFKTTIPNFPLYIFLGLIFWMFFAEVTKKGLFTIQTNRYLLENIRINKLDIYYSGHLSIFFAFLFNLLVFFIASFFFNINYNINLLFFPLVILNLLILTFSINLLLSIIYIYLRDFNHVWDVFMLVAFWINPIVYSESVLYEHKIILYLNPLAGIIINARNSLLYGQSLDLYLFTWNYVFSLTLLAIGLLVFKIYSKKVVEIL